MLQLLRKSWALAIVAVAALSFIGVASLVFNRGDYTPPITPPLDLERISIPSYVSPPLAVVTAPGSGVVLLDIIHSNNFDEWEINSLLARVKARGYSVETLGETRSERFTFESMQVRLRLLEEKLRKADSFIIALPQDPYAEAEIKLVEDFVGKGGKLLLIGDPSREHLLESVGKSFGIVFENDYLYNVVEHDLNYRNVFLRDFRSDPLTRGLESIAFYTTGSIKSTGPSIAVTDANTYSSMVERVEPLAAVAKSRDGRVVALGDLTFMAPPQDSVVDNSLFISNLAQFLTESERRFDLTDFPHFFGQQATVVAGNPELLSQAAALRAILESPEREVGLAEREDPSLDMIFLGTFDEIDRVQSYLLANDIRIGDLISTPLGPDKPKDGTALLLLHQQSGRNVLLVLADDIATLEEAVGLLESGGFRSGLVSERVAILEPFAP